MKRLASRFVRGLVVATAGALAGCATAPHRPAPAPDPAFAGWAALADGRRAEAERLFADSLAAAPADPVALAGRATIAYERGESLAALADDVATLTVLAVRGRSGGGADRAARWPRWRPVACARCGARSARRTGRGSRRRCARVSSGARPRSPGWRASSSRAWPTRSRGEAEDAGALARVARADGCADAGVRRRIARSVGAPRSRSRGARRATGARDVASADRLGLSSRRAAVGGRAQGRPARCARRSRCRPASTKSSSNFPTRRGSGSTEARRWRTARGGATARVSRRRGFRSRRGRHDLDAAPRQRRRRDAPRPLRASRAGGRHRPASSIRGRFRRARRCRWRSAPTGRRLGRRRAPAARRCATTLTPSPPSAEAPSTSWRRRSSAWARGRGSRVGLALAGAIARDDPTPPGAALARRRAPVPASGGRCRSGARAPLADAGRGRDGRRSPARRPGRRAPGRQRGARLVGARSPAGPRARRPRPRLRRGRRAGRRRRKTAPAAMPCPVLEALRREAEERRQLTRRGCSSTTALVACGGDVEERVERDRARGRTDEAIALLRSALELDPDRDDLAGRSCAAAVAARDAPPRRWRSSPRWWRAIRRTRCGGCASPTRRRRLARSRRARRTIAAALAVRPDVPEVRRSARALGVPLPLDGFRVDGRAAIRSFEKAGGALRRAGGDGPRPGGHARVRRAAPP